MKWIGLTGGIATGKSTVSEMLRRQSYEVVDADAEARLVVGPGTEGLSKLVQEFGKQILNSDQTLDRAQLAQIVFKNPAAKNKLEEITHPLIQNEVAKKKKLLEMQGAAMAFYDVPLLFEKKLQSQFDAVVLVYCPRSLQIERMKKRNAWSENEILLRLDSQIDIEVKKGMADFVIDNSKDLVFLQQEVMRTLTGLR